MKKNSRLGYAHAVCMDCEWELTRINAQGVGAKHAKYHKHRVLVTTEIESVYDGREDSVIVVSKEIRTKLSLCAEEEQR